MEKILRELKVESLFPKFAAQHIEPENVSAFSDEELSCFSVSTIGDRLRVGGLCANAGKDHPSVAANVLSERMSLFSGRSRSSRRGAKRKAVTKRSWTVSFICVADRYQKRIPSSTDKQVLFHAGLGLKKIIHDLEEDEHDVLAKITCGDKGDDGEVKGFNSLRIFSITCSSTGYGLCKIIPLYMTHMMIHRLQFDVGYEDWVPRLGTGSDGK